MTDMLEGLFGSRVKARIIRFFLLNDAEMYSVEDIVFRNKLRKDEVRRTLKLLEKMGLLTHRVRKRKKYFMADKRFPLYTELFSLVVAANRYPQCKSFRKIRHMGDVKLVMVSGIFMNYPKSKADMIVVANNTTRSRVNAVMSAIEAEVGREIRYVLMDSEEFKYRMEMLDRFLTDFFEGPHEEVINKVAGLKRLILNAKK